MIQRVIYVLCCYSYTLWLREKAGRKMTMLSTVASYKDSIISFYLVSLLLFRFLCFVSTDVSTINIIHTRTHTHTIHIEYNVRNGFGEKLLFNRIIDGLWLCVDATASAAFASAASATAVRICLIQLLVFVQDFYLFVRVFFLVCFFYVRSKESENQNLLPGSQENLKCKPNNKYLWSFLKRW